jgi:DNA-binding GntR family transcriptional regulator
MQPKNQINGRSRREHILGILRESIYSGLLPPGSKLVESQLANQFETSRTPIREAILQLESEGLIKILPNKGAVVNIFSIDEIEEIYLIFGSLSGTAASLSVQLVSDDDIEKMETCIVKMEAIRDNDDRREYFILNNVFHSAFLKPCGKRLLLKLIKNYTKQVGRYWYLLLSHTKNMELFSEEHRDILKAFKLRDPKMVKERVETHIRSFGNIVVQSLKSISTFESIYTPASAEQRIIDLKIPIAINPQSDQSLGKDGTKHFKNKGV